MFIFYSHVGTELNDCAKDAIGICRARNAMRTVKEAFFMRIRKTFKENGTSCGSYRTKDDVKRKSDDEE